MGSVAPLTTARLTLEPNRAEFAPQIWAAIEASLPELTRWMTWGSTSDPDTVATFAREAEEGWRTWTKWDFVVVHDGNVAGTVGLNRYDRLWRTCNLGYWIRTDLAGQGIATEAASAVVEFAFSTLDLNRLELVAATDNVASQRVAEKLGFRYEGTKREGTFVEGRGVDCHMYGLLAADERPTRT